MRVALYARYSDDRQNERSAEDQLAALRLIVQAKGWTEVDAYKDEAISAAALVTRPAVQALLADGMAGRFDLVMAEALDRMSRDQEDTAHLYKRLTYAGVAMETLTEGRIGVMHVGLAGTMNQLFLEQLAHKTRRGLEARVRAGFSGGGRCFGYDLVEGKTGQLTVNAAEAETIREIYGAYAAGHSCRTIAARLNAQGLAGPRGGTWTANAIAGDRRAGDGILCQELYIGVRVFNRRKFRKHPDTGRRSSVINPPEAWIRNPVPDLRILTDDAWSGAQARHAQISAAASPQLAGRQPKRLLSGLLRCGLCSGPMVLTGDRYQCSRRRDRGLCANGRTPRVGEIERRTLDGIRRHLLSPGAIADATRAWQADMEAERRGRLANRLPNERDLAELERRIARTTEAYVAGAMELADYGATMAPMKAKRGALQAALAASPEPDVVQLHPGAAAAYAALAASLHEALTADDGQEIRAELRKLIEAVDFIPGEARGDYALQVHGRLADLLHLPARTTKNPPVFTGGLQRGLCGMPLGAGARSGQSTSDIKVTFAA